MFSKRVTSIIFIVFFISLLLYDLVLYATGHSTISAIIWEWNLKIPVIPFIGGFIAGHLWWK